MRRRFADVLIRTCEMLAVVGLRSGRSRLKKYWSKVIRQDMAHLKNHRGYEGVDVEY